MRRCFEGVEDEVAGGGLSLADCVMSGLAIFALKYPSLLQFEQDARGLGESAHEPRRENLRSLFGVERAPSDVRLRERLDEVDPRELRAPFKRLFARAQRGGALAGFEWLEGRLPAVGGRHGALLVVEGALRERHQHPKMNICGESFPPDSNMSIDSPRPDARTAGSWGLTGPGRRRPRPRARYCNPKTCSTNA